MEAYAGQLAALGTATCWGFNAMMFTHAGRKVGSDTVTHVRLWLALAALSLINLGFYGEFFPWSAGEGRFLWLGLSGVVGFVLGDLFLFEAFVLIGTARALVVKTMAPALAALFGWIFLQERLGWWQLLSMSITLAGISLVVLGRKKGEPSAVADKNAAANALRGVLYACIGALGQGGGVVLSKLGLDGSFPPISATLIRVAAGTVSMFFVAMLRQRVRHHMASLRNGSGMAGIAGGTLLGPVIGVSLSLYALQKTEVGVASTLMEMAPVLVMVISALWFKERLTWREWTGTAIAVCGAAMLFV